jgi:ATP-dependent Lon protease
MTATKNQNATLPEQLVVPALAVRDMVVFPHMMAPLFMGRDKSIKAAEQAAASDGSLVLLLSQKNPKVDDPARADLWARSRAFRSCCASPTAPSRR